MSVRNRFGSAAAIALMATVSAVLLSACGPDNADSGATAAPGSKAPGSAAPGSAAPGTPAPGGASHSGSPAPGGKEVNGTSVANHLTISTGTRKVAMNGTLVDFGSVVRDLAWSPDGKKAVYVGGSGDLMTANPDGTGGTTLAKHPDGEEWSHPTWQHAEKGPSGGAVPDETERYDNIVFTAKKAGVLRLVKVPAKGGSVEDVSPSNSEGGDNANLPQPPQTGNTWANAGGRHAEIAYANTPTNEVYIYDDYIRPATQDIGKGSQPALSPDGGKIVFVRAVNGHDHLFARSTEYDQKAEKDLTPSATTDFTEPAWSPDGRTVAARTPEGIDTVPADGSAAPTQVSTLSGLPVYRP
ncbi:TolB family protein [Kitasatospora sp. NPDC101157]|uniref:TolB family protein n=1 Tax=Kitasatospora sp. NPDC101157 TaxID=3364098 RepID=UPI00380E91D2